MSLMMSANGAEEGSQWQARSAPPLVSVPPTSMSAVRATELSGAPSARERRRRKVGRAYDMALEIARVIPRGSEVLDVGCGNGFIAHHLSAILGISVLGINLGNNADAPIDYRQYDGAQFP